MPTAIRYPLGQSKYVTFDSADSPHVFEDAAGNSYDFSAWEQMTAFLLVSAETGGATSLDVVISTSEYDSTDNNDWVDIITFTTVTLASVPVKEIKITTNGLLTYCRATSTFTGGSAQTWTGFIVTKHVGRIAI